ncbi:MAG: SUMF1/EgtB/PvdO family nonheme iron enzyme [Candidatus Methanoperedens sp.]|nr:SUMF1/EgtB/PvdO family nonheme iron enzyme [Candidatus Methanoperedens sp.]
MSAGKSTLEGFTAVNAGNLSEKENNLREIEKELKSAPEGFVIKLKSATDDAGIMVESNNNIIRNNTISNNEEGIRVMDSINNIVSDNTAINNFLGIYLYYSKNNTVGGNTVSNNMGNGIHLYYSNNNIIIGNYVSNDKISIDESSNYNILYQNNLDSHSYASDYGTNQWDNGINIGNYWNYYTGTDANNDGIGDTPYNVSGDTRAQDRYPLMVPYMGQTLQLTPLVTDPAESDVHVHKVNKLFLINLSLNHNQLYDFDTLWTPNVWSVKNLNYVIFKISTPLNFTKIENYEEYQNGSEVSSSIQYTHTGNDYVWNLSLVDRIGSNIDLYTNEINHTKPWADLAIIKTQEGNNTRLNITYIPAIPLDYNHLRIRAERILSYTYPNNLFSVALGQSRLDFRSDNPIQNQAYNFSVLVNNPEEVNLWLDNSFDWVEDQPSNHISLPVSGFGSINVSTNVPVKWNHRPVQPQYVQDITINMSASTQTPTFTPKYYSEHPKNVEVDGEINLNKNNLSFGDTLNIKARIKLIGSEKIYGAPVLILWKMEKENSTVSMAEWQLTETNQVIKEFKDYEDYKYWWIPPSNEFNFDVNWKWENPEISSGTYQIQVAISTLRVPNSPEGWLLSGDSPNPRVQLKGAYSWIPIPTSVSQGLSSYSAIIGTIITVLAIFLIFLAVVYSNRIKDEKLIIQRIDELIVGVKTKKFDNNELRDKLIEINKELSHKESYGTSYKGYFFAVALVLSVLLLLGYLTLAPEAEAPINMKSINTPALTIKATPNITQTPTVTPTTTTTATPVRLKVVEDVFNGDASAVNEAGLEIFENGYYYVVDWQGDKYVALKGKTNKLVKLILEQKNIENKVLTVGETWDVGGGWTLTAQAIDAKASPRQVWLVLNYKGVKKDDRVRGMGSVYTYVEKSIGGESDVPLFVTYIADVYAGATSDMVQLRYTWAVDTTIIQTPKITPTVSPTPTAAITETPTPEHAVVATPTGKIVYGRVDYREFSVSNLQIYTGDAISWNNFDEYTSYTIVEMDQKLPNMTLRPYGRLTYVFNTTGNYRFGLYYPLMKTGPRIQNITVRVSPAPMITSITDQKTITNSIGMEFVQISAGEFDMGSNESVLGFGKNARVETFAEGPIHHVKIANAFYMDKYEVTQKQWREVMGNNPSNFKGDNLPVEEVSWNDAQEFIRKLNEKEGTNKYRLPSEAEWEYAARAGTTTRYSFGDDESNLGDYAWYEAPPSSETHHEVGQKKPNPWGLYDMHGNVGEWVRDLYYDSYDGAPTDGSAWEENDVPARVIRSGGWGCGSGNCRSAARSANYPGDRNRYVGFRLLRVM